jgi:DNA-binding beta-propeller fold protein YncE
MMLSPAWLLAGLVLAAAPDSLGASGDTLPFRLRATGVVAGPAEGRGRLLEPAGVAADHFGRIHVTDAALHRLQRYDARGLWLGEAGSLGSGTGEMRRPGAVAVLGTLSIAVLDRENHRVLSYDLFDRLQGTLIDLEDAALQDELGRVDAVDLAADRGGGVYIADAERDRLLAFDSSGRYLRTLGGFGVRPGSFRGLSGLAVGGRGDLVTAERVNARVQRLDPGGRVLAWWAIPVRPVRGALPVAVDDSGHVAVADQAAGTLRVFDQSGHALAALSGLRGPRALAFTREGAVLVAEAAAGRVRRFALEPNPEGAGRSGE